MATPRKTTVSKEEETTSTIFLERIDNLEVTIPIIGLAPVIPHKWSEKALRMMREKQTSAPGTARAKREPKNPEEEAEQSCYWLPPSKKGGPSRPAIPATAFKAAIVDAARLFEGVTMTLLKQSVMVMGELDEETKTMLVPLLGEDTPIPDSIMREDTPRNASGVADLRYRYAFHPWRAELNIWFNPKVLALQSIPALVDAAGQGGVGDWRPSSPKSKTGSFGTFAVDDNRL